jgi:hypothetical protein
LHVAISRFGLPALFSPQSARSEQEFVAALFESTEQASGTG